MDGAERVRGRRWLVWGLGRLGGGVGVARWLASQGAEVTVVDRAEPGTLTESVAALSDLPIRFHLGEEDPARLEGVAGVVVNPAVVPSKSVFFQEIVRRGLAWTTEINLFLERCPAAVIAVTGSYGKSTTSAMIAAMLEGAAGRSEVSRVFLGGNIGRSLLDELHTMQRTDWAVMELSSAQLEHLPRIAFAPAAAVITNLHPHHLDRHETFEAYAGAKLNILGDAHAARILILGPELSRELENRETPSGLRRMLEERLDGREVNLRLTSEPVEPIEVRTPGRHNQVNAQVALNTTAAVGVPEAVAREVLATFGGLPHRLECVGRVDDVDYVNDSKATSPSGTRTALEAIGRPVVAIVGGAAIDEPLEACVEVMVQRCRAVACLGETGRRFACALREGKLRGGVFELLEASDLEEAVAWAMDRARAGDVVLFSPGATSFDRYVNFEARGAHFKAVLAKAIERAGR
ncbi:MAG: UDP-N-acetylmuramoyl-L-alanine--D-glutamate ligase [Phycisphaerales bacterium]|nr:UDP-N-acetylmuramoyl-L-alanine--D-glutamate ligase [Phycisphaerales bacterium]